MPELCYRGATPKFEPDKAQYSTPYFWPVVCFLYIETQNLGKTQGLEALPAVAPLNRG